IRRAATDILTAHRRRLGADFVASSVAIRATGRHRRSVKKEMDMNLVKFAPPLTLIVLHANACVGGSDSPSRTEAASPLSVVVIGDSIAAGEGINYGYTYYTGFPNKWTGGTDNPTWQGNYQLCHDSAQAYGDVLAAAIGASLAKFACTGSTYDNGVTFDRRAEGVLYRPAQFGNWLGMTSPNPDYDAAMPDVVIITLGANDVSFVDVITFCATGYTDPAEIAALSRLPNLSKQLRANFVRRFPNDAAWLGRSP